MLGCWDSVLHPTLAFGWGKNPTTPLGAASSQHACMRRLKSLRSDSKASLDVAQESCTITAERTVDSADRMAGLAV